MSSDYLKGKGVFYGTEVTFNNDFSKDPNRYEKKYAGMKSSKGGHSYQLVTYNPDGTMVKFWIVGLTSTGEVFGLEKGGINKVPHITIQFGTRQKMVKEKSGMRNKDDVKIKAKITEYVLDHNQGTGKLVGSLEADWGDDGNLSLEFNVLVKDIGLKVR